MTADVITHNAFLLAREKKRDPKGYAGRKINGHPYLVVDRALQHLAAGERSGG